jgi:hypothetical protein
MITERIRRAAVGRPGYTGSMVDTERAEPDDGEGVSSAAVDDAVPGDREPGDGSVQPPSPTPEVDALRTPGPAEEHHGDAEHLPLETPLE